MTKYNANKYTNEEVIKYTEVGRIEIDGIEHWFDEDTGEIMQPVKFLADHCIDYYKPFMKHTEVLSMEQLRKCCKNGTMDSSKNSRVVISGKMKDLISIGIVSLESYRLFLIMVKHIQYRNIYLTNLDTLCKVLQIDSKNLNRKLTLLKGLMTVIAPHGVKNPLRVCIFNKSLVWKGDLGLAEKVYE